MVHFMMGLAGALFGTSTVLSAFAVVMAIRNKSNLEVLAMRVSELEQNVDSAYVDIRRIGRDVSNMREDLNLLKGGDKG